MSSIKKLSNFCSYYFTKLVAYFVTFCLFEIPNCHAALSTMGNNKKSGGNTSANEVISKIGNDFQAIQDIITTVLTIYILPILALVGFVAGIIVAGMKNSGAIAMAAILWALVLGVGPWILTTVMSAIV